MPKTKIKINENLVVTEKAKMSQKEFEKRYMTEPIKKLADYLGVSQMVISYFAKTKLKLTKGKVSPKPYPGGRFDNMLPETRKEISKKAVIVKKLKKEINVINAKISQNYKKLAELAPTKAYKQKDKTNKEIEELTLKKLELESNLKEIKNNKIEIKLKPTEQPIETIIKKDDVFKTTLKEVIKEVLKESGYLPL